MVQRKFRRGYKGYIPLVLMLVFFVFMLPRSPRFNYEYKKGEHWMYETLVAEFDFPILKTDEQLKTEKDSVKMVKIPYFDKKQDVLDSAVVRLDRLAQRSGMDTFAGVKESVRNSLNIIYSKGVLDPNDSNQYKAESDDAVCALLISDNEEIKVPAQEVFTMDSARDHVLKSLRAVGVQNPDSLFKALDLRTLIDPDLRYNSGVTEDRYSDKMYHPSYTSNYMSRSEVIVEKGEVVTDRIANLLAIRSLLICTSLPGGHSAAPVPGSDR